MVTISPMQRNRILLDDPMKNSPRHSAVVVADSSQITPICNLLAQEGFGVELMRTDELLQESNSPRTFDLVLLDLVQFDDRWQVACERLRTQHDRTPIVVLSESSSLNDRIKGFDSGADEFIGKPYSVREMTARLRALLRRSGVMMPLHILRYADMALDLTARMVLRGRSQINLSRREFALLVFFVQNAERVLSREQILNHVWGSRRRQESNVVDVYVNYLRNKIEHGQHLRLIHTVRGRGYILHHKPPV